ncbi:MAG: helix-turn-helix transcriptional regulator [Alphaproteobacteria bacterium]|nr:helix-turn-helix transcriptional regulator [Alphaproteobacteria bacterium]
MIEDDRPHDATTQNARTAHAGRRPSETAPAAGAPWRERRRAVVLAALLFLQTFCTVFFIGDVVGDVIVEGVDIHIAFEAAVAGALAVGVVFAGLEMRRTIDRSRRAEAAVSVASGAFADLISAQFRSWNLTPAESDVALFALKGFDIAEIAELRGSAPGTVRAQLARVYAKAGVSSRTQLLAVFTDELLAGALPGLGMRSTVSSATGGQSASQPPPP